VTPLWLKLMSMGRGLSHLATGKIIYFDQELKPRAEPIQLNVSLTGLAVGMMRPIEIPFKRP
jgi:hypothetical protein